MNTRHIFFFTPLVTKVRRSRLTGEPTPVSKPGEAKRIRWSRWTKLCLESGWCLTHELTNPQSLPFVYQQTWASGWKYSTPHHNKDFMEYIIFGNTLYQEDRTVILCLGTIRSTSNIKTTNKKKHNVPLHFWNVEVVECSLKDKSGWKKCMN